MTKRDGKPSPPLHEDEGGFESIFESDLHHRGRMGELWKVDDWLARMNTVWKKWYRAQVAAAKKAKGQANAPSKAKAAQGKGSKAKPKKK